jgi:hypothetical protein
MVERNRLVAEIVAVNFCNIDRSMAKGQTKREPQTSPGQASALVSQVLEVDCSILTLA